MSHRYYCDVCEAETLNRTDWEKRGSTIYQNKPLKYFIRVSKCVHEAHKDNIDLCDRCALETLAQVLGMTMPAPNPQTQEVEK